MRKAMKMYTENRNYTVCRSQLLSSKKKILGKRSPQTTRLGLGILTEATSTAALTRI